MKNIIEILVDWKSLSSRLMPKILLFMKPFILWFDKVFTVPYSVKLITADHYVGWYPLFKRGMVFITDTYGQGSNLLNPSKGKHGAIYFGKGLRTFLEELNSDTGVELSKEFKNFYRKNIDRIRDDAEYVVEALGEGVTVTNIIKFITTKDVVLGFYPTFVSAEEMAMVSRLAVRDLGVPYDFEFHNDDNAKYCFEVLADAYLKVKPDIDLRMKDYVGYKVITADTFKDTDNWLKVIDSKSEFPTLYKR